MVLFFLIIFLIFIISIFFILKSSFKLSIIKLNINTQNKMFDYEFKFGLYIFNKIKIIGFKINKKKIEKIKNEIEQLKNSKALKLISKIDINKISLKIEKRLKQIKNNNVNIFKIIKIIIKNLKFQILKYNMNLEIGVDDAFYTSLLTVAISSLISIALKLTLKNLKKCYYIILPIYEKGNILKLNLNCIINLKLVHIINIIYLINKEGRSDKYVRTSNRKSYDYCHE